MMGMPGGMEWVILLALFALLVVAGGITIIVVVAASRRRRPQAPTFYAAAPLPPTEIRLAEADRLLQAGQISQTEHQEMRARILGLG